jgi:hypothetical protein
MLNRDTTLWFPLRVRHSSTPRLMAMKHLLEKEATVSETYIPMEYRTENFHTELVPAINNIIFVRTTYNHLKDIRQNQHLFEPLRYIMRPVFDGKETTSEVLHVPDSMMKDFIRVTSERQSNVIFLDNLDFACKPGMKACITEGLYTGVMGVVKRIKKNLCIVIPIEGVAAAAIMHVPRKHLRYISDAEYEELKNQ